MGLHLCYELSLPGDRSEREVAERFVALHGRALALPLDRVSEVVHLDACELAEPTPLLPRLAREASGRRDGSGLRVVVRDETGYWTSRDPRRLVDAVAAMNRVVSRFAGTFTDAMRAATADGSGAPSSITRSSSDWRAPTGDGPASTIADAPHSERPPRA